MDGKTHKSSSISWLSRALLCVVLAGAVRHFLLLTYVPFDGPRDTSRSLVDNVMTTPLLSYKTSTGGFPTTAQGLRALLIQPVGVANWKGPYILTNEVPKDPWGTTLQYLFPGIHHPDSYDLWSLGPDKMDGTADDIVNW